MAWLGPTPEGEAAEQRTMAINNLAPLGIRAGGDRSELSGKECRRGKMLFDFPYSLPMA
jgi:hypothetical protein